MLTQLLSGSLPYASGFHSKLVAQHKPLSALCRWLPWFFCVFLGVPLGLNLLSCWPRFRKWLNLQTGFSTLNVRLVCSFNGNCLTFSKPNESTGSDLFVCPCWFILSAKRQSPFSSRPRPLTWASDKSEKSFGESSLGSFFKLGMCQRDTTTLLVPILWFPCQPEERAPTRKNKNTHTHMQPNEVALKQRETAISLVGFPV